MQIYRTDKSIVLDTDIIINLPLDSGITVQDTDKEGITVKLHDGSAGEINWMLRFDNEEEKEDTLGGLRDVLKGRADEWRSAWD